MKMSAQNKGFTTFMKTERGFTLVELMVVISIIAILSMIGLTMYSSAQKSARDGKRRADVQAIQNALEQFRTDAGAYPNWPSGGTGGGWFCSTPGGDWIPGLSGYFSNGVIPVDPINNGYFGDPAGVLYAYCYRSDNSSCVIAGRCYILVVALESPTSTELKTSCNGDNPGTSFYKNTVIACNQQ